MLPDIIKWRILKLSNVVQSQKRSCRSILQFTVLKTGPKHRVLYQCWTSRLPIERGSEFVRQVGIHSAVEPAECVSTRTTRLSRSASPCDRSKMCCPENTASWATLSRLGRTCCVEKFQENDMMLNRKSINSINQQEVTKPSRNHRRSEDSTWMVWPGTRLVVQHELGYTYR
jgi:hypothetical protein